MEYIPLPKERVLAFDPISRGFGFVVLEDEPLRLVDWGTAICGRTPAAVRDSVRILLRRYRPTSVALEDPRGALLEARRVPLAAFVRVVRATVDHRFRLLPVLRERVLDTFGAAGATTKAEIVRVLVERFPELESRVPPPRPIWASEDARSAIFDALALASVALFLEQSTERRD